MNDYSGPGTKDGLATVYRINVSNRPHDASLKLGETILLNGKPVRVSQIRYVAGTRLEGAVAGIVVTPVSESIWRRLVEWWHG